MENAIERIRRAVNFFLASIRLRQAVGVHTNVMQSRKHLYATNNKRQNSRSTFKLTELPHIYIRIRVECVDCYLYR